MNKTMPNRWDQIFRLLLCGLALGTARAQPAAASAVQGVERGLEEAVKWKWSVVPSEDRSWGLDLPEPPPAVAMDGTLPVRPAANPAGTYEVKKGDALVLIAKRFGRTVAQIKAANSLTSDLIHIGDLLTIPTVEECIALGLPPEAPKPKTSKSGKPGIADPATALDQQVFLLQIFLDREGFRAGPISGRSSMEFQKLVYLFQSSHPEISDPAQLQAKALAGVGTLTATYRLKHEDFRFIAPPKAQKPEPEQPGKPKTKAIKPTSAPLPTYEEMTTARMLAYRSPWEFVAERFHAREELIRQLNPSLPPVPPAGSEFKVPNVRPFVIEHAFQLPLQPAPNPQQVITAAVVDLSRLEVYRNDQLIRIMPVFPVRPGLRGRGTWTVLQALPRPRLVTRQEPREVAARLTNPFFVGETASAPTPPPTLPADQFLPAGPNNPLGIWWIDLAKADSPTPLPFGLHGTSIPSELRTRTGLGGFRMTNWDINELVRMLPVGTPLHWKQTGMAPPSGP